MLGLEKLGVACVLLAFLARCQGTRRYGGGAVERYTQLRERRMAHRAFHSAISYETI